MENILPVATQSATQTLFITTTGAEKVFTLIGLGTVTLLAILGLFAIAKSAIKNNLHKA